MPRKNFNRRGKVGRRQRARKSLSHEPSLDAGFSVKFDSAPKKTDSDVISTKKRRTYEASTHVEPEEVEATAEPVAKKQRSIDHGTKQKLQNLRKELLGKSSLLNSKQKKSSKTSNIEESHTSSTLEERKIKVFDAAEEERKRQIRDLEKHKVFLQMAEKKGLVKATTPTTDSTPQATSQTTIRSNRLSESSYVSAKSENSDIGDLQKTLDEHSFKPKFGEVNKDPPASRLAELGKALAVKLKGKFNEVKNKVVNKK
jgi:hypothetical protein